MGDGAWVGCGVGVSDAVAVGSGVRVAGGGTVAVGEGGVVGEGCGVVAVGRGVMGVRADAGVFSAEHPTPAASTKNKNRRTKSRFQVGCCTTESTFSTSIN